MRIKLLTFCDINFKAIGDISIPLMREYCQRHNIEFLLYDEIEETQSDVYWNKISIVKKALKDSDWVLWCDADILIQQLDYNWSYYLSKRKEKNLIVSSDFNGLCLGFFFLRSNKWSFDVCDIIEKLGNIKMEKVGVYDTRNQREQDTLKVLCDFFNSISEKIELIPETMVSNPKTEIKDSKPFAHHFWASTNLKRIAEQMVLYKADN